MSSTSSILDQLREQCSSFDITQLFNHYCALESGHSTVNLTCSIPIQVSNSKLVVDYLALSKQEDYSLQWTQIYSPTRANQMIGNSTACSSLLQWLQSWSKKCSGKKAGGKNKQELLLKQRKGRTDSSDPDFLPSNYSCDRGDFTNDSSTEEELLPAALLCGPHGSGKTAAVYACAAESGFKVTSKILARAVVSVLFY